MYMVYIVDYVVIDHAIIFIRRSRVWLPNCHFSVDWHRINTSSKLHMIQVLIVNNSQVLSGRVLQSAYDCWPLLKRKKRFCPSHFEKYFMKLLKKFICFCCRPFLCGTHHQRTSVRLSIVSNIDETFKFLQMANSKKTKNNKEVRKLNSSFSRSTSPHWTRLKQSTRLRKVSSTLSTGVKKTVATDLIDYSRWGDIGKFSFNSVM